ncbi:MAG: ATP-dependent protease ATPase subunit HslU [Bacteroidota bacterium]
MSNTQNQSLTPQQIVKALDQYIVGQKNAKRSVAIALRARWRRQNADSTMNKEILPNNILMKGSTGTGKTEIGRRLAKLCNAPFVKVEATRYTEEGYVGRNVDSMIQELAQKSLNIVKAEKQEFLEQQAKERVDNMILDILIPPLSEETNSERGKLDSTNLNEETRKRFLDKIRSGELDQRMIEIRIEDKTPHMVSGMIEDSNMVVLQDMMSKIIPRKNKKKQVTVANARQILLDQELERLLEGDMDNIKKEALERAKAGIVFIDEIDKIAANYTKVSGPDVSREGVQRNLLPIIEGSTVITRIGPIPTDHILFIAAGAFHNSQPSDLMPELQGRFPIRVVFHNLTEDDFYHILQVPKNSITKQQQALFAAEKVELNFTDGAIQAIAKAAYTLNQDRDIGARRLLTVMVCILDDYSFDVPEQIKPGSKITIDANLVEKKLAQLMRQEESTNYIL